MAQNKTAKESETAKEGDTVDIHYTGTFDDSIKFDSSEGKDPLEFTLGESQVIKGFEMAVLGMKVGEEKNVKIPPEMGYGIKNEKLIQEVPRDKLPKELDPKKDMVLTLKNPKGRMLYARISDVKKDSIILDLNHPLAGKNLNFSIKLIEIK